MNKPKSQLSPEYLSIDLAGRTLEDALTSAEISGYRSVLGQLWWSGQLSRPDLCVGVSLGIVIPRVVVNLKTCFVIGYADAAFANLREKSLSVVFLSVSHITPSL